LAIVTFRLRDGLREELPSNSSSIPNLRQSVLITGKEEPLTSQTTVKTEISDIPLPTQDGGNFSSMMAEPSEMSKARSLMFKIKMMPKAERS